MYWIAASVVLCAGAIWLWWKQTSDSRKPAPIVLTVKVPASEAHQPPGNPPVSTSNRNEPQTAEPTLPQIPDLSEIRLQTARNRLLNMIGGDDSRMQRLINAERDSNPQGTMIIWVEAAVTNWERDNRSWQ